MSQDSNSSSGSSYSDVEPSSTDDSLPFDDSLATDDEATDRHIDKKQKTNLESESESGSEGSSYYSLEYSPRDMAEHSPSQPLSPLTPIEEGEEYLPLTKNLNQEDVRKHLKERFEEQFNLYKEGDFEKKEKEEAIEIEQVLSQAAPPDADEEQIQVLVKREMEIWKYRNDSVVLWSRLKTVIF